MSTEAFTKENLDACLKELGKEYRKRSGTAIPAEIIEAIIEKARQRRGDIDAN